MPYELYNAVVKRCPKSLLMLSDGWGDSMVLISAVCWLAYGINLRTRFGCLAFQTTLCKAAETVYVRSFLILEWGVGSICSGEILCSLARTEIFLRA